MGTGTVIALVVVALVVGLALGTFGGFGVGLIFIVGVEIIKKFAIPVVIGLVVLAAVAGAVSAASGGDFWTAVQVTLKWGAIASVVALVLGSVIAVGNGW